MSKLASQQAEVLKLVQDREVSGTRVKYIWVFTAGSRVVTHEVHALEYNGLGEDLVFERITGELSTLG